MEQVLFLLLVPYFVLAWLRPRSALLLLLALLPTYLVRGNLGGIPTTWLEIAIYTIALVSLIRYGVAPWRKLLSLNYWRWLAPIGLWVLAAAIGVAIAPDKRLALGILKGWIIDPLLLVALLAIYAQREAGFERLWRHSTAMLLTGATATSLVVLVKKLLVHSLERESIWYDSPNVLAMYLVPILVAAVISLMRDWRTISRPKRATSMLACVVVAIAVIATGSYAAIVATLGAGAVYGILRLVSWQRLAITLAGALITVGIILPLISVVANVWPLPSHYNQVTGASSGEIRLILWREARQMIYEHPIVGIGLGQWQAKVAALIKPGLKGALNPGYLVELYYASLFPHNVWLTAWLNVGLLGVVALAWLVVSVFRAARDAPLPAAVLSAIMIHGMVDTPIFKNDLSIIFWLTVLAAVGTEYIVAARNQTHHI